MTKMLRMFGLAEGSAVNAGPGYIGWGSASANDAASFDVSFGHYALESMEFVSTMGSFHLAGNGSLALLEGVVDV